MMKKLHKYIHQNSTSKNRIITPTKVPSSAFKISKNGNKTKGIKEVAGIRSAAVIQYTEKNQIIKIKSITKK
jgi:hypothetical protein